MERNATFQKLEELGYHLSRKESHYLPVNEDEIEFYVRMLKQYYDLEIKGVHVNGRILFHKVSNSLTEVKNENV